MKRATALIVTAAACALGIAVLLASSLLSPVSVQAGSMDQERPQIQGTLSVPNLRSGPDLRRPGILLRPTSTPTPRLVIIAPNRIAPSLGSRLAPQLRDPNDIGQLVLPFLTPEVNWAACGDTLPMYEGVRANAPGSGESCTFTIQSHPGAKLDLTTRPLTSNMTLDLVLTDEAGNVLEMITAGSPENSVTLKFTVPASGTATLWIMASVAGIFEMRISPPMVAYVYHPSCGGNLTYGDEVHHRVLAAEAQCIYAFTGQAGDVVVVTMDKEEENSSLDPLLELRDESGAMLTGNNDTEDSVNAMLAYVLPVGGKYTIVARDYDNTNTGPYLLSLSLASAQTGPSSIATGGGTATPPPGCGGALSIGASVDGLLATRGAECVYTLFGTKDKTVTLKLVKTTGALDPYLELYPATYPSSSRLAYNDDSAIAGGRNSQITSFKFQTTDFYKVVASAWAGNSTGPFRLTASQP